MHILLESHIIMWMAILTGLLKSESTCHRLSVRIMITFKSYSQL